MEGIVGFSFMVLFSLIVFGIAGYAFFGLWFIGTNNVQPGLESFLWENNALWTLLAIIAGSIVFMFRSN